MVFARRRSTFDDRPDSMVHICRLHDVRLTALRIQIACIFDDTDDPLDAQQIWGRMRAKGLSGDLASVYRLLREMKLRGAVTLVATRDRGEFFQKRRSERAVELLNIADKSLVQVADESLLKHIEQLVADHGFRLAGRIVISVAPSDPA